MESALIAEEMEPAIMTEATFRADRFAKLMQKRNLTDGKLAYASGVSRTMIYYMRKGERSKVSAETIAALAGPLGTSTQYLMGQTDDPSPMQKTMSGMIADIVLPTNPSQRRVFCCLELFTIVKLTVDKCEQRC